MVVSSRVGTVVATGASSQEIETWRRKGSNFANSRFYQLTVSFYWIGKCDACNKQET
jgi:hypothetical protein